MNTKNNIPMRAVRVSLSFFAIAATTLMSLDTTEAGQITMIDWFSGVGSVAGEFIDPNIDENNDNVVGVSDNDLLVTQKSYDAIGPVDLEFTVIDTGGVTEYTFNEGVYNGTGVPWIAYRMELGFGVGADFVPSPAGDGLDFDALDYDSPPDFSGSGFFTTVDWDEDVIEASGGIFPVFGFPTPLYRFNIDVPDGIDSFTIRQQPIPLPEPSSVALTVLGLTALVRCRRHR